MTPTTRATLGRCYAYTRRLYFGLASEDKIISLALASAREDDPDLDDAAARTYLEGLAEGNDG